MTSVLFRVLVKERRISDRQGGIQIWRLASNGVVSESSPYLASLTASTSRWRYLIPDVNGKLVPLALAEMDRSLPEFDTEEAALSALASARLAEALE